MCPPRDFEWIAMESSRNPHLVSASRTQTETLRLSDRTDQTAKRECWITTGNMLAPVQVGGSSGFASEPAGHFAAAPQRADAEILMDAQPPGAHTPRADEEHTKLEILPVASPPAPREPSKDEIEQHNLLHDPAMPWCDISSPSQRAEMISTDKRDRKSFQ